MKFRVHYTRIITFEEDIEAGSWEEAEIIAQVKGEEMPSDKYKLERNSGWVMPAGKLSLSQDTPPTLFLDGKTIYDGQILLIQHGKGTPQPGRARYNTRRGEWQLDSQEFLGNTYSNLPLSKKWIKDMIAAIERDEQDNTP